MVEKSIKPVITQTSGQRKAVITAIDYSAEDCFIGEVEVEIGDKNFEWNINGTCRDATSALNLNCQAPEIKELIELIERKRLGK